MPITRSSATRITALLLMLGLVALIGIVATSFWLVERSQNYFEQVVSGRQVRAAAVDVRNDILEMQTGQRGYLLASEQAFLDRFHAARDRIIPHYALLERLLVPQREDIEPMQQLREALERKIDVAARTIDLHRAGNTAEAIELFRQGMDRTMIEEAMAFLDAVLDDADVRISRSIVQQREAADLLRLATIIGGLVIILVVGGAVWTTLGYTRDLIRAREEVETFNTELEDRVEERTQELVRANQEIQRFAYIVTHDLRAPLVNIMGFTSELDETMKTIQNYVLAEAGTLPENEILEARTAAAEDLPEAIGFIRSSTRKMDGLINAILKISRDGRRPLKPERLDLAEVVGATADSVAHQVAETEGEVRVEIDLPPVISDRLSLEQIFGNLFDNAVKYRRADRPLEIEVTGRRLPMRRVAVEIRDNGRGIAPQDHERVFDLFRRSGKQDQPGEGIGLAHVRTLVRNLGGEITLQSELGEGATFTVTLPEDIGTVMRSIAS